MRIGWPARRDRGPVIDAGLQSERTAMAWQRTALGVGGISALLVHAADRDVLAMVPGFAGLLVALGLLVLGETRYTRVLRRVRAGEPLLDQVFVRLLAITVVALAVCSALVIVLVRV